VVVGVFGEPATLDPYSPLASELTWQLVRPVYPSLYRMLPDGSVEADLAADLAPAPTGVTVTLARRRWSNGDPITARDVVKSVERARPPSGLAELKGARAVSRRVVLLEGNIQDWPATLGTVAYVLPGGLARKIYGGPFVISGRVSGLRIDYAPNPRWPGTTGLRRLKVVFTVGTEMLISLLERERIDVAMVPSSLNLDQRFEERGIEHAEALGWDLLYLDLDGADTGADLAAGLSHAIDRQAIVDGFVRNEGRVADGLHPGPGPGGADGRFARATPTDRPLSGTIQLAAPEGDELAEFVQRVIQIQLEAVGMTVELVTVEPKRLYGDWAQSDPFDAAVRRAGGAPGDRSARVEVAAIPIAQVSSVAAWNAPIAGIAPNPTYDGLLWNVEDWLVTGS
jgi:ABC-type transport system substrate-binding protein